MNEETDWGDYESGPFCRHWSDYDCEVVCARCGHRCTHHSIGNDALRARVAELEAAFDNARDAILHDRGSLAEAGMTADQTNAVLAILDAYRKPCGCVPPRFCGVCA